MSIISQISNEDRFSGIGIFSAPIEEVKNIMDEDPAIKEGVIVYAALGRSSFPGGCLS